MPRTASSSAAAPTTASGDREAITARAPVADGGVRLVEREVPGGDEQRGGLERVAAADRVERVAHVVGAGGEADAGVEQRAQRR